MLLLWEWICLGFTVTFFLWAFVLTLLYFMETQQLYCSYFVESENS